MFSETMGEQIDNVQQVMGLIAKHFLKIDIKTCFFAQTQV